MKCFIYFYQLCVYIRVCMCAEIYARNMFAHLINLIYMRTYIPALKRFQVFCTSVNGHKINNIKINDS